MEFKVQTQTRNFLGALEKQSHRYSTGKGKGKGKRGEKKKRTCPNSQPEIAQLKSPKYPRP